MKAGINFAMPMTTVSPTYAEEIQRPEYGNGLDGVIRARRDALVGILNGIDHDEWNPAGGSVPAGAVRRRQPRRQGRRQARAARDVWLHHHRRAAGAAGDRHGVADGRSEGPRSDRRRRPRDLTSLDATFVVVGTGEPRYQEMWRTLARDASRSHRRVHRLRRAARASGRRRRGLFLMPSRFEPCGLNQMYSLRYGTVPVVRAVGGLVDTVQPYNPRNGQGTGFLFAEYHPAAMMRGARRGAGRVSPTRRSGRGCRRTACGPTSRGTARPVSMSKCINGLSADRPRTAAEGAGATPGRHRHPRG